MNKIFSYNLAKINICYVLISFPLLPAYIPPKEFALLYCIVFYFILFYFILFYFNGRFIHTRKNLLIYIISFIPCIALCTVGIYAVYIIQLYCIQLNLFWIYRFYQKVLFDTYISLGGGLLFEGFVFETFYYIFPAITMLCLSAIYTLSYKYKWRRRYLWLAIIGFFSFNTVMTYITEINM